MNVVYEIVQNVARKQIKGIISTHITNSEISVSERLINFTE